MKDYPLILLCFLLITTLCHAQDTIKPVSAPIISHSKADSLLGLLASKTGADTNATASEISENIDKAFTLIPTIPKKGATQIAWIHYFENLAKDVMLFLGIFCSIFYYMKHKNLKSLMGAGIILLMLGFSSCKTGKVVTNFTANSVTVKEQIGNEGAYIEETAIIHVAPGQFDTAGVLIIAPDNVTNGLLVMIKNDVCKVVPSAPICK